jgi:predicted transcriptional regulator
MEKSMSLNLIIPDELASDLERTARAAGKTPEEIAISAIRRNLMAMAKLNDALSPVREAFVQSGLTEDEAIEVFEREKHDLRRERTTTRP